MNAKSECQSETRRQMINKIVYTKCSMPFYLVYVDCSMSNSIEVLTTNYALNDWMWHRKKSKRIEAKRNAKKKRKEEKKRTKNINKSIEQVIPIHCFGGLFTSFHKVHVFHVFTLPNRYVHMTNIPTDFPSIETINVFYVRIEKETLNWMAAAVAFAVDSAASLTMVRAASAHKVTVSETGKRANR